MASVVVMATAEVNGFSRADAFALCGTCFSVVVVLIGVRQFEKSLKNCLAVISGTLIFGICSPALIVGYLRAGAHPDAYRALEWQLWVILGFVCGLAGWSVTQATYSAFTKLIPSLIDSFIRRFFSRWSPPPADRKPPTLE